MVIVMQRCWIQSSHKTFILETRSGVVEKRREKKTYGALELEQLEFRRGGVVLKAGDDALEG